MRELSFSKKSITEIREISEYIEDKWSYKVKVEFLEKLQLNLDYIVSNPENFQKAEYEDLRKCVVTKQTTIFYKIASQNKIHIVSVFDTRQNSKKIKKQNS